MSANGARKGRYKNYWGSGYYGGYAGSGSGGYGADRRPSAEYQELIEPLLSRLRETDRLRCKLQKEGGDLEDMKRLTQLLSEPLELEHSGYKRNLRLSKPEAMLKAIRTAGRGRVHLQVRRLECHMPAYYLCRTQRDYWHEYSLVVEDLHVSPDYPMGDGRFVQLMYLGHEEYYLRLSPFRADAADLLDLQETDETRTVDRFLHKVGRHVFQAAWHDDQRVGILAARHFDMPDFLQAIELLYLCLSGDLCEVRQALDQCMLRFFEDVYPQPAIRQLLGELVEWDGQALNQVARRALRLYTALAAEFRDFLTTPIARADTVLPLYKLLFGNIGRVGLIADEVADAPAVRDAVESLRNASRETLEALLTS